MNIEPTFKHTSDCAICEQGTNFVAYGDEKPWCRQCGHNEGTLTDEPDGPDGCPDHPEAGHHMDYGLAGGGYGAYKSCAHCGAIFEKFQDDSDE